MNSRDRFAETMRFGRPDRPPYLEEGIRDEVVEAWRKQGLSSREELNNLFPFDRREEIELNLDPKPKLKKLPTKKSDLKAFRDSLDPDDRKRLPEEWKKKVKGWQKRDHTLMLRVHRGFFLTMGVNDWKRFENVIYMLCDDPQLVHGIMDIQGRFAARLAENVLQDVEIDAAIFSEPIGGNDRPLLSPRMYEEFVLKSYEPVLDVLRAHGVQTVIFRTFANARVLLPSVQKWGINCLWASDVSDKSMDYASIRSELGPELRLIGGIDLNWLREGEETIRENIEKKVKPLLADGGFVPLASGRVRENVSYRQYAFYRKMLKEIRTSR